MSPLFITFLMFGSLIGLIVTGRHIFVILGAIGTLSVLTLWGPGGEGMLFNAIDMLRVWYVLLAIPCFILMGTVLARSGIADALFSAIYKWMGGLPGGLGMGTIGICALIAAMVGGATAGTVTAGFIALPSMLKRKYDKLMITGLIQSGGALGFLIPPSIVLILYGIIARVSIGHLFLAGVLPGILLAFLYIAYIGIRCRLNPKMGPPIPLEERVGWGEKFRSLRVGITPIVIIFLVLGLLFMGVTSLIESAAIGAVAAIGAAAIFRKLTWKLFRASIDQTLRISSMLMWIVAAALLFSFVYDGLGASKVIADLLGMVGGANPFLIIIIMQLSFIGMGTVLDDTAMLLIVAPLYIPLVAEMGFSLVWYGILYTITVEMACMTPPFGYSLFIMKGIVPKDSGITMGDIYRSVIPFVGIQAVCLGMVMAFPQIALWLPNLVFGG